MGDTGRYMYAICRNVDPAVLTDFRGLGGGRLELVEHENLAAVVSTVDLDEYGEEGLKANLENLQWLEEAARGHDAVIQAVASVVPTAPLRLATICLDDAGVRRRLVEWHAALDQILDRVDGRMEWSVKVYTDARAERAPAGLSAGDDSGASYLRRKKEETAARVAGEAASLETVERIHEALAGRAVASRRLPAQDPRLTGHQGTMVHNGAYLVETGQEDRFTAQIEELVTAHPQVTIDCRGPWPPYSFAMLEQR